MASSRALAWLAASLAVAACSVHHSGLGAGVQEGDDGGGLIGQPGGAGSGGAAPGGSAGGAATGGSVGSGGAPAEPAPPIADAASALPADAAMMPAPPPPPVPDAAPLPPDAPPLAPDAALLPRDTAPPASTGTIACGSNRCLAGKEACCVTTAGASCIPMNGLCLGGSLFRCDGPEDCDGGRVCCLRMETGGYRSACARAAECAQAAGTAICRTGADCPSFTPTCSATTNPMLSVCR
jgi:hypothetical protein